MRRSALLASALLSGCQPAAEPEAPATTPNTSESAPAPASASAMAVGELVGEWRLAGVDGVEFDAPYAATVSIDAARIHLVADCINVAWSYTAGPGTIATTRVPVEGCGRGLYAQEEAIVAALDAAERFEKTPANGVDIHSDTGRVTLFRQ